jgi:hypothetical protein
VVLNSLCQKFIAAVMQQAELLSAFWES